MDFHRLFLQARYTEIVERGVQNRKKLSPRDTVYLIAGLAFVGRLEEAELEFQRNKKVFDQDQTAVANFFLGIANSRKGDFEKAAKIFLHNLLMARKPGASSTVRFFAFQGLGFFRHLQCRYKNSLKWASKAFHLAFAEGGVLGQIFATDLRAHSLRAVGEYAQSIIHFERVEKLARQVGNTNFADTIKVSLACLQVQIGNIQKPIAFLRSQYEQLKPENTYSRAEILIEILRQQSLGCEVQGFDATYLQAQQLIEQFGNRRHRLLLLCRKSYAQYLAGNSDAALRTLLTAEQHLDLRNDLQSQAEILGLRLKILGNRDFQRKTEIVAKLEALARKSGSFLQARHLHRLKGGGSGVIPEVTQDPLGDLIDQCGRTHTQTQSVQKMMSSSLWGLLPQLIQQSWSARMISTEIIPERLLIVEEGQVYLSKKKVTPQISRLLSCLCTEPCRKEDLVSRIWGYEYDPIRHDPMVLTLVQRLRDCMGEFRSRLKVDQGIYEISPHYGWINPKVLGPSFPNVLIKFNDKELSYRQFQILAFIDRQGSVSIGQVMKSFQISRMTCHRELESLRKKLKISRSGKGRGSIYLSSMIFR